MAKVLHPNQYQVLLEYQDDIMFYELASHHYPDLVEPTLAQHVQKELEVTYTPNETTSIYYKRTNRDSWDALDKKFRYYRNEYGHGYDYAKRLCNKYAGKAPKEILILGLNHIKKKLRDEYFFKLGLTEYIRYMKDPESTSCDHLVINGVVHLKYKQVTTNANANLFKYELLSQPEDKYLDVEVFDKYLLFVSKLEAEGYSVDADSMSTSFIGKNVKGYVSITPDNYTYDLVFADHKPFFNKISRCPLVFRIPKSAVGITAALKELEYLGSKYARYSLQENTYEPKHVHSIKWWH